MFLRIRGHKNNYCIKVRETNYCVYVTAKIYIIGFLSFMQKLPGRTKWNFWHDATASGGCGLLLQEDYIHDWWMKGVNLNHLNILCVLFTLKFSPLFFIIADNQCVLFYINIQPIVLYHCRQSLCSFLHKYSAHSLLSLQKICLLFFT